MKTTSEQDTGFCAECKTLRISQICSQNSATGFDHRVQNALRVQNAVSWVSKFAVGAHFRGCVWLENIASVSEYAGVVDWCTFSRVLIFAGTPADWKAPKDQLLECLNCLALQWRPTTACFTLFRSQLKWGPEHITLWNPAECNGNH